MSNWPSIDAILVVIAYYVLIIGLYNFSKAIQSHAVLIW